MQLEQMAEIYQPMASQERQSTYFVVRDLESLSADALYTGKPCGPKFVPASNCGLGPGIARKTESRYIERYLPPHTDEKHGEHINLGSYLPGKKKPFLNLHIDLNYD